MPQARWLGSPSDIADLNAQFQAIRQALEPVPIYLGEFGVNVDFIPNRTDAMTWLKVVRGLSVSHGMTWSFWTYFMSPKGISNARNAKERLQQWDCSDLITVLFDTSRRDRPSSGCHVVNRNQQPAIADAFLQARNFGGGSGPCRDRRPLYAVQRLAQRPELWRQ